MAAHASIAILISGRGSNMAALIAACNKGHLRARVTKVISDQAAAGGLEIARSHEINAIAIERKNFASKARHEAAILDELNNNRPDIICLAGFMRILSAGFVREYQGKILNIHPSLLPKYTGLNTHARALAAGDKIHGATVHIVTEGLDEGPVVAQMQVAIKPGDDVNSLEAKVLKIEHGLYVEAVRKVLNNALK